METKTLIPEQKTRARALFTLYSLIVCDIERAIKNHLGDELEKILSPYAPNLEKNKEAFEKLVFEKFGLKRYGEPRANPGLRVYAFSMFIVLV